MLQFLIYEIRTLRGNCWNDDHFEYERQSICLKSEEM
jgi:hypothetical protein